MPVFVADPELVIPDPFPSNRPRPIVPVDEEDVDDPDTGQVHAISEQDSTEGEKLARQKLRATSQKIQKVERQLTPTDSQRVPPPKKTD